MKQCYFSHTHKHSEEVQVFNWFLQLPRIKHKQIPAHSPRAELSLQY